LSAGKVTVDTLSLPFQGSTPLSHHCSYEGARDASERVGRQCVELLTAYKERGPLTDRQAAAVLGVDNTTICARRNELFKRKLVVAVDSVIGERGRPNTRWGLA
jgi:predicted ArsR family transcriptional regulator